MEAGHQRGGEHCKTDDNGATNVESGGSGGHERDGRRETGQKY